MRIISTITLALAALLITSASAADPETRFSFLGAGEGWFHPELGGHGVALGALDISGLPAGARFSAELNTDTLRLSYGKLPLAGGRLEAGISAAGEAAFAGLLPDYYRQGKRAPGRGLWASYVAGSAYVKANLPGRNFLGLTLTVRRWFFRRTDDTDPALILPPEPVVFEPRLRYTLWLLEHDAGFGDRHRLYPRVRGLAIGAELGLDLRSRSAPWGARDPQAFAVPDTRNDAGQVGLLPLVWLRAGWQLHDRLRWQLQEAAALGHGLDDLNRHRVGGMTPYVVPVAGAPWAAFLAERFAALQWSWHVLVAGDTEVGVLADVVYLDDTERAAGGEHGAQAGVGAFLDLRAGPYQLDVRLGWSPTMSWESRGGQIAALAAFGRSW